MPNRSGVACLDFAAGERCRLRAESLVPASDNPTRRAHGVCPRPSGREERETPIRRPRSGNIGHLIARQPCFAETHYRLGMLLEQTGVGEAYQEYVTARDLDGMPMRCLTPFQQVYREVAGRHRCILIDGQSYFHAIGRHGLLDDELFQDAMHPSFRGQIALAQAVLIALHARGAFGWPEGSATPIISPAECAAHFSIDRTAWHRIALWWKGFHELVSPLRYDTNLRMQKRQSGIDGAARIDAGTAPEAAGLPNVGIPAGVPLVNDALDSAQVVPTPGVMPCFVE